MMVEGEEFGSGACSPMHLAELLVPETVIEEHDDDSSNEHQASS